jgi:hypothetical protein
MRFCSADGITAYQRRLGEETICKIDCIESSDAPWIYARRDDSQKQAA